MSDPLIIRPVWRTFRPRWLARAVAHVRAGGHAAMLDDDDPKRLTVLLGVDDRGKITTFGLWALLSIEQRRWTKVKDGPAEGLATARIKPNYVGSVLDWCERDAVHPGAMRGVELDCIKCAACCVDADVVLDDADLERFRRGGREDLTSRAYIHRADGRITLRFAENGRCQLLADDRRCSIYPIRPFNCRAFVAGSEACLAAREETLGLRDGAPIERVEVVDLGTGKRLRES